MLIKTFEDLRAELEKSNGSMFLGQVPEDVYRSHGSLSQSELKVIAEKSPAHLKHQRRCKRPQTAAQKLGTAIHAALLEPESFEKDYIRTPKLDRRKTEDRKLGVMLLEEAKEMRKVILPDADFKTVVAIRETVAGDPALSQLLGDGLSERACFGRVFGVDGKARPDYYVPNHHKIVDLKSTKCASRLEFERDIRKYRYHWQAVWYSDLIKELTGETPEFEILALETSAPYCAASFKIKFDLMAIARKEMQASVDLYRRCLDTGFWPGYPRSEIGATPSEWLNFKKSMQQGA